MVLLNRRSMRRLVYGLGLTSIVLVFVGLQVVGKDGGLKATDDYSLGEGSDQFLEKYQSLVEDHENSDESDQLNDPLEEIVLQDEKAEKHRRGVKVGGEDERKVMAQQSHLIKERDKSTRSSDHAVDNNDDDDQNADGEIKIEDKKQDTNLYIQEDLGKVNQITDQARKIGDLGSQGVVDVAKRPGEPNLQVKDHEVHDKHNPTSNHDAGNFVVKVSHS